MEASKTVVSGGVTRAKIKKLGRYSRRYYVQPHAVKRFKTRAGDPDELGKVDYIDISKFIDWAVHNSFQEGSFREIYDEEYGKAVLVDISSRAGEDLCAIVRESHIPPSQRGYDYVIVTILDGGMTHNIGDPTVQRPLLKFGELLKKVEGFDEFSENTKENREMEESGKGGKAKEETGVNEKLRIVSWKERDNYRFEIFEKGRRLENKLLELDRNKEVGDVAVWKQTPFKVIVEVE
jgi:hypothetical protein